MSRLPERATPVHPAGLRSGLFWRTFFLIAFLIAASMAAWVVSFRVVERTPRGEQIAAQVSSIVTITRAALLHSAPESQRELLFDLDSAQGIRIYLREADDVTDAMPDTELMNVIEENVRRRLGQDTQFAGEVNDIRGFWVSFRIDDDDYWLMMDRDRIESTSGIQWIGWVTVTLVLSLLGAVFISRLINQPLARLSSAARAMARGLTPAPLPDRGPAEIREANQSFNQMVQDLNQVESDRAVILAGISHDLRTPIARMLLEVEMAKLPEDARKGMQSDLAQMEAIIGQFLDYARPSETADHRHFDLSALMQKITEEAARLPDLSINASITPALSVTGNPTDIGRIVSNLIENARRYGKTPDSGIAELDISAIRDGRHVRLEVADHGSGLPEEDIPYLMRPFTRMDSARTHANGAGLGLAIVDRVVQRHHGRLEIKNRETGGLAVRVWLKSARVATR
jgi:two-component system, OmpR family, osmolarity sensor histidine kinase EnvZ